MSEKGNEPAYPQPAAPAGYRAQWAPGTGGLTKREHIATEAMKALLSNPKITEKFDDVTDEGSQQVICCIAVEHADALLLALEKEVDDK